MSRHTLAPSFMLACLALAVPAGAEDSLVRNGDFDSPSEEGWTYEGYGDGSRGVYSEPSRPGNRVYLLQLRGEGEPGRSSIRQTVRVMPGTTYLATVEFCFPGPDDGTAGPEDAFSGSLGGLAWFRETRGRPRSEDGWRKAAARFRAEGPEVELQLELRGSSNAREASTVAVDSVSLREIAAAGFAPFRPGYRLAEHPDDDTVTLGWSFAPDEVRGGGFALPERIRATTGQSAAWLPWDITWHPGTTPVFPIEEFRADAEAWARSGVVPVLTLRGAAPLDLPPDVLEGSMRTLARALGAWGFPVVLRPWPDMERQHKSGAADAYVGMWRRARGWFVAEGAGHVAWWWTPAAFGDQADPFYPGDGHVDFVGCRDVSGDLDAIYGVYALRYRRKPLAIPESLPLTEAPALGGFARRLTERYPRLEVYCFTTSRDRLEDSAWVQSFGDAGWDLGSPHASFQVPQRTPPRPMAVVRTGNREWQAVVTNLGDERSASVSEFHCQFHDGDPAAGGKPVGRSRTLRLRRGEERTIREPAPEEAGGVPWLRMTVRPGSEALRGPAAPSGETRDFRAAPGDGG